MSDKIRIFLSYCWENSGQADEIERFFHENSTHIVIIRDRNSLHPYESLRKFMESIREHDYAILLVSDEYLKSENCMYEVCQLMEDPEYIKHIFPVVLDKEIFMGLRQSQYVIYWSRKVQEYKDTLAQMPAECGGQTRKRLKERLQVQDRIETFLSDITDMNLLDLSDMLTYIQARFNRSAAYGKAAETYDYPDSSGCILCGLCVEECIFGAIELLPEKGIRIDKSRCVDCGLCREVCPTGAI